MPTDKYIKLAEETLGEYFSSEPIKSFNKALLDMIINCNN